MGVEKIYKREDLVPVIEKLKKEGKKIIFTNGCFDVLHVGHAAYLSEAKALGDILIVAVNNDASVKRLKGESRPVNCHEDRMALLSYLQSIDYVVGFGEDKATETILLFQPDIYVKGGDLKIENIPEAPFVMEYGGIVKALSLTEGHSTTKTIEKIINK